MYKFISYNNAIEYLKEVGVWCDEKNQNWSVMEVINNANDTFKQKQKIQDLKEALIKVPSLHSRETLKITKLIVPSETIKEQILLALEYLSVIETLHDKYEGFKSLIDLKNNKDLIEVDSELL